MSKQKYTILCLALLIFIIIPVLVETSSIYYEWNYEEHLTPLDMIGPCEGGPTEHRRDIDHDSRTINIPDGYRMVKLESNIATFTLNLEKRTTGAVQFASATADTNDPSWLYAIATYCNLDANGDTYGYKGGAFYPSDGTHKEFIWEDFLFDWTWENPGQLYVESERVLAASGFYGNITTHIQVKYNYTNIIKIEIITHNGKHISSSFAWVELIDKYGNPRAFSDGDIVDASNFSPDLLWDGKIINIQLGPIDPDLEFSHWEVEGDISINDPYSEQTSIMINGDGTLRAVFYAYADVMVLVSDVKGYSISDVEIKIGKTILYNMDVVKFLIGDYGLQALFDHDKYAFASWEEYYAADIHDKNNPTTSVRIDKIWDQNWAGVDDLIALKLYRIANIHIFDQYNSSIPEVPLIIYDDNWNYLDTYYADLNGQVRILMPGLGVFVKIPIYNYTAHIRYLFHTWKDDNSDNPRFIESNNYTAYMTKQYRLDIIEVQGGTTDPPPGTYWNDASTQLEIQAIPSQDYQFSHFELYNPDESQPYQYVYQNPFTLTLTHPVIVKPVFIQESAPKYTITFQIKNTNGNVINTATLKFNNTEYYDGDSVQAPAGTYTIQVGSLPNNYAFDHWEVNGDISIQNSTSASANVSINGDGTITLVLRQVQQQSSGKLRIWVLDNALQPVSNELIVKIDGIVYTTDASGMVEVELSEGWHIVEIISPYYYQSGWRYVFDEWSDNNQENPRSVYIYGGLLTQLFSYVHREVEVIMLAVSAEDPLPDVELGLDGVNKTTNANGTASFWVSLGVHEAVAEDPANEVYIFVQWFYNGNSYSRENPEFFTIQSPANITAVYTKLVSSYVLTITAMDEGGNLLQGVEFKVYQGDTLIASGTTNNNGIIAFSLDEGSYEIEAHDPFGSKDFLKWILENGSQKINNPLALNLNSDYSLTAVYSGGSGGVGTHFLILMFRWPDNSYMNWDKKIYIDGQVYETSDPNWAISLSAGSHTIGIMEPEYFKEWGDGIKARYRNINLDRDRKLVIYFYVPVEGELHYNPWNRTLYGSLWDSRYPYHRWYSSPPTIQFYYLNHSTYSWQGEVPWADFDWIYIGSSQSYRLGDSNYDPVGFSFYYPSQHGFIIFKVGFEGDDFYFKRDVKVTVLMGRLVSEGRNPLENRNVSILVWYSNESWCWGQIIPPNPSEPYELTTGPEGIFYYEKQGYGMYYGGVACGFPVGIKASFAGDQDYMPSEATISMYEGIWKPEPVYLTTVYVDTTMIFMLMFPIMPLFRRLRKRGVSEVFLALIMMLIILIITVVVIPLIIDYMKKHTETPGLEKAVEVSEINITPIISHYFKQSKELNILVYNYGDVNVRVDKIIVRGRTIDMNMNIPPHEDVWLLKHYKINEKPKEVLVIFSEPTVWTVVWGVQEFKVVPASESILLVYIKNTEGFPLEGYPVTLKRAGNKTTLYTNKEGYAIFNTKPGNVTLEVKESYMGRDFKVWLPLNRTTAELNLIIKSGENYLIVAIYKTRTFITWP